jgi:hypothetical protein
VNQTPTEDLSDEEFERVYEEHASDFVSDYASSNIVEDMAESFAQFVVGEKKTGTTIADQKVNFFYGFEELTKLRTTIRENLK